MFHNQKGDADMDDHDFFDMTEEQDDKEFWDDFDETLNELDRMDEEILEASTWDTTDPPYPVLRKLMGMDKDK